MEPKGYNQIKWAVVILIIAAIASCARMNEIDNRLERIERALSPTRY